MRQADYLLERFRLKSQISRWRIGFALLFAVFLITLLWKGDFTSIEGPGSHYIARYQVEGMILDDVKRDELFKELSEDDSIAAVLVYIDSPGGTSFGGEQLYHSLRSISEEKPVITIMRTIAASGGYMGALGGDYILAQETTLTGSVGVLIQAFEVHEAMEKVGVTPIEIKSSPLKAAPSPFEPLTEEGRESIEVVIEDTYRFFKKLVQDRRKLTDAEMELVGSGRIFTGRQAVDLKMVDALGGEEQAITWLAEKHKIDPETQVRTVEIPADPSEILQNFTSSLASVKQKLVPMMGLMSLWQPES